MLAERLSLFFGSCRLQKGELEIRTRASLNAEHCLSSGPAGLRRVDRKAIGAIQGKGGNEGAILYWARRSLGAIRHPAT
jgi:hypothetical protein